MNLKVTSFVFAFCFVIILFGCNFESGNNADVYDINEHPQVFFHDLESDDFLSSTGRKQSKIVKSGKYASSVPDSNSYSVNLNCKLKDIDFINVQKVQLSAWFYAKGTHVNAALVLVINDQTGESISWKGKEVIDNNITPNKWFCVNAEHFLKPEEMNPNNTIKMYAWNRCNTPIFVDDFTISFPKTVENNQIITNCDFTENKTFISNLNTPPYPFQYFENQFTAIENEDNQLVFNAQNRFVTGNFLGDGKDEIIIINDKTSLLEFYQKENNIKITELELNIQTTEKIITAFDINADGKDELITRNANQLSFYNLTTNRTFEKSEIEFTCSENDSIVFGHFAGSSNNLLIISENGSWKLYKINSSDFELITESSVSIEFWNKQSFDYKLIVGQFSDSHFDDIYCIAKHKQSGKHIYSTFIFIDDKIELLSEIPFTIGNSKMDSLTINNQFINILNNTDKVNTMLVYNSDFRFDLKQIEITENGFAIMKQIDFKNFPKDLNPKYYENAILLNGYFLDTDKQSLLVVGFYSHENDSNLENSIQLYSLD